MRRREEPPDPAHGQPDEPTATGELPTPPLPRRAIISPTGHGQGEGGRAARKVTAVQPPGWHLLPEPGPEPASGSRHRRLRLVLSGALAAFAAAAIGVGFLTFSNRAHVGPSARSPRQGSQSAAAQGSASSGSSHSAPSAARTGGAGGAPAAAAFPALTGVGCAPLPGTSAIMGMRSAGGDGWEGVSGGLPACGGRALASRKTGALGVVQDVFTWAFRVGHPATCTAEIFVADTNPSSGLAHYNVYGDSLAAGARIGQFVIEQAAQKGRWVPEGSWNVAGTLRIQLTDAPAYAGDRYHVTASAARASCR